MHLYLLLLYTIICNNWLKYNWIFYEFWLIFITIYIVEYKEIAEKINQIICNILLIKENKYIISNAINIINEKINNNNYLSN